LTVLSPPRDNKLVRYARWISFALERDVSLLAGVTQLVECDLAKVDVAGSNPVSRSNPSNCLGTFVSSSFVLMYWRLAMLGFLLWCVLLILCWPLALAALFLYPIVWLLLLPFRIVGIAVGGVLELVWAIITLPARVIRRVA
jgi:hypothetical protein